jgi:nuclear distribution protein NudE
METDEFQASSKELEDELEKELAATEKQQTDLKEKIKRLEAEKEDSRVRHLEVLRDLG